MALSEECEFCGTDSFPALMVLSDHPAGRKPGLRHDQYCACANCLLGLVNLSLTPTQFLRAKEKGGNVERFYLHGDFYDPETGQALQPKMPGLAGQPRRN